MAFVRHCNTLQHTTLHCSTLQYATLHCISLQHTTPYCSTPQHTTPHYTTLHHTTLNCSSLKHTYKQHITSVRVMNLVRHYGVATIDKLLKIIGLFCKRVLSKRRCPAQETYNIKEPTTCSHPMYPPYIIIGLFRRISSLS